MALIKLTTSKRQDDMNASGGETKHCDSVWVRMYFLSGDNDTFKDVTHCSKTTTASAQKGPHNIMKVACKSCGTDFLQNVLQ